jgi:hypothetical protein
MLGVILAILRCMLTRRTLWVAALGVLAVAVSQPVFAHVKWFVDTSFAVQPLPFGAIVTPTFLALMVLSMVTIGSFVFVEPQLDQRRWYQSIDDWLSARCGQAVTVMRIAAGGVLLMNWQADAMLVPEFTIGESWIGWAQFSLALLLLFVKTTPLAGIGMILLYFYAISQYGVFHMLDYIHYPGVGLFLALSGAEKRTRALGIPVLYVSVGFSLCWVAMEKLVYPEWALVLLRENPVLALGLPIEFFLVGAAFVELSLGYLLIMGVLGRPLALTITIVFFLTTMVFGKTEVIGHTLLHGALIVFILHGTGDVFRPPIAFHRKLPMRMAFGAVNFAVVLAVLSISYTAVARETFENFEGTSPYAHTRLNVTAGADVPSLDVSLTPDAEGGWNAELQVEHFRFAPEHAGERHVMGEGHVHLTIDGVKTARWYSAWGHIPELPRGEHEVRVILNTNDHQHYALDNEPIQWTTTLVVD